MADLRNPGDQRPAGSLGQGAVGVLDDDPWADVPGADEQVMTDRFDAPPFVFDAVDDQPLAPEVEVVEQGTLDLNDAPLLHARDRALDRVAGLDAREARLFAERADALVQVQRLTAAAEVRNPLGAPLKGLPLEMSGTRRLGSHKVQSDVDNAVRLTEVLRLTLAGLRAGTLNVGQAQAVLGATQPLTAIIASEVERRLFANPRAGSFLPGELRTEIERLVLLVEAELDPTAQMDREAHAKDDRHVSTFPLPDGMAGMFVAMTAEQGLSHAQALDKLCRWVKQQDKVAGTVRTATQRRTDVLASLPGWIVGLIERCGCKHQQGCGVGQGPLADAPTPADENARPGSDEPPLTGPSGLDDESEPDDEPGDESDDDGSGPDGPGGSGGPDVPPPAHGSSPPGVWPSWAGGISPPPEAATAATVHIHIPLGTTLGQSALPRSGPPGAGPPGIPLPLAATMNVHLPLATALGHSDAPAYLERHGWISAAQARGLLPHATLRPVHVDEHGQPVQTESPDRSINRDWKPVQPTGTQRAVRDQLLDWARRSRSAPPTVITTPEPQYAPSAALERHLRMRDLRCTGPGCSQPSHRCQLDHLEPHEHGGPTVAWNLGAKSERCHNAKTHGGWSTHRHPDGSTTWTSPLKRRYWTKAFWPAPPAEDPTVPLPGPDDPGTATVAPCFWSEGSEDHTPGLRSELEDRATRDAKARADAEQQAARLARRADRRARDQADPYAWLNPIPSENHAPPPF